MRMCSMRLARGECGRRVGLSSGRWGGGGEKEAVEATAAKASCAASAAGLCAGVEWVC